MRKTLLIAAAALASSIISSQAQVYSQNIVGYVNVPVPAGYVAIGIPLDTATGNSLTNEIPAIINGTLDQSYVYIWNNTKFDQFFVDSSQGGLNDAGDNGPVPVPVINPGTAIFIQNLSSGGSNTVTFAGTVHVEAAATGTNVVGFTTNNVTGEKFVSSKLPIGGGVNTVLGVPTSGGGMDQDYLLVPHITGGALHGYDTYFIDWANYGGTGICDSGDNGLVPEPVIPVSGGFFINALQGPVNWTQSL